MTYNFFILIALLSVAIVVAIILFFRIKRKKIEKEIASLQELINTFLDDLSNLQQHYITETESNNFVVKWNDLKLRVSNCNISSKHKSFDKFNHFKNVFSSIYDTISLSNEKIIRSVSDKYAEFFSNIDGKSLDFQQRAAVIADDERILVLAGAGSGKTLTIAAKVKYLCEIKHINPSEILLISFTKKSAQEMTERIQNKLGIPAEATTFHKLGLDIIKRDDGIRPEISESSESESFP